MSKEQMTGSDRRAALVKRIVKFFAFILLIIAPIAILWMVFTPFAAKKISERIIQNYQLEEGYTKEDIVKTVAKMHMDAEFAFYFYALDKESIGKATLETAEILDRARSKEDLLDEITQLKEKVDALTVMFYHLDYSEDFVQDPKAYPDLSKIMWQFMYEEFKLAVLGVCYKSNYDEEFVFQWSKNARLAAHKLKSLMRQVNQK